MKKLLFILSLLLTTNGFSQTNLDDGIKRSGDSIIFVIPDCLFVLKTIDVQPTDNFLRVTLGIETNESINLEITNSVGRNVMNNYIISPLVEISFDLDISTLEKGSYVLSVNNGDYELNKPIIKE